METAILTIENKQTEIGTILIENNKTLASGKNKFEFIQDRVNGFLLSSIPAGKVKVKVEITVTVE